MARPSSAAFLTTIALATLLVPTFGLFDAEIEMWLRRPTAYGVRRDICCSFAPFFAFAAAFANLGIVTYPTIFCQRTYAWKKRQLLRGMLNGAFATVLIIFLSMRWDLMVGVLGLLFAACVGFLLGFLEGVREDNREYNHFVSLLDKGYGVQLNWEAPEARAPMVRLYREAAMLGHRR